MGPLAIEDQMADGGIEASSVWSPVLDWSVSLTKKEEEYSISTTCAEKMVEEEARYHMSNDSYIEIICHSDSDGSHTDIICHSTSLWSAGPTDIIGVEKGGVGR